MEAYLDNSATTQCGKQACELMMRILTTDYGNPSSLHLKGLEAERYIRNAREQIARTLKADEKEIVFTSGGTESNNLAIIGAAMANRRAGTHLVTTAIEHPSVRNAMEYLKGQGFEVTYLPVDKYGIISIEDLREAVREDTILVSIMQINNEIGAVEPIEEAAECIKKKNPLALFHVDAVQSYGKMKINPKRTGIDLLSVSGHKIHGPKGSGFLYIREKTKVNPVIFGGGQQRGMRSGTENVPAIAGLGAAAAECYEAFEEKSRRLYEIKELFVNGIGQIEGATVNGRSGREAAPHIVSVSFAGVRSEVLLHDLEQRQIYVSAGSACSSNTKKKASATLKAIGVRGELLESTVRFSFSVRTTKEEILYVLGELPQILELRRKYTRR